MAATGRTFVSARALRPSPHAAGSDKTEPWPRRSVYRHTQRMPEAPRALHRACWATKCIPSAVGLAAPQGLGRLRAAMMTAGACGLAALGLAMAGRSLVGGTIHAITQASIGGQAILTPLGRLLGEPGFGAVSAALISTGEGLVFGLGLALGLTYRHRER